MIVGDFNIPLSIMGRISRQKMKKTADLNNTIDQMDLTDIYTKLFTKLQNVHFSQAHMEHSP